VGTESGTGRLTEWSVLPVDASQQESIAANSQKDETFAPIGNMMGEDLGSRSKLFGAKGLIWYPAETDVSIRPGWFYHATEDSKVRTPENLMEIYFNSVGRNSVLLLNIPPDKDGLISEADVRSLQGWRKELDATFYTNLATDAKFTTSNDSTTTIMECTLKGEKTFDVLLLKENIQIGQRVEKFVLDYPGKDGWTTIAEGTTIGYKRLLRFPSVTTTKVRLRILSSRLKPAIAEFGLYKQTK
jgi:alpha-L-fucosidase